MNTIFKKIIDKEIESKIIFENKKVIAFLDVNPKQEGHFLVVPKNYSKNLLDIKEKDLKYLFSIARKLAIRECKRLKVNGFKLHVNNEKESGQEVFHTHIHIIPSPKNEKK